LSRPLVDPVGDEEAISKAVEFIQSETGKQLLTDIETVVKTGGTQKGIEALKNQLTRAILSGVMDPKTAKEIAIVVAKELGNVDYSMQTIAQINEYLGPGGKKLETIDGRIQMIADVTANITNSGEIQNAAQEMYDAMGIFSRFVARREAKQLSNPFLSPSLAGLTGTGEDAVALLSGQVRAEGTSQVTQMISDEYKRTHQQYLEGNITFEEYIKNQKTLMTQLDGSIPSWQRQIEIIELINEEASQGKIEIDSYKNSIMQASKVKLASAVSAEFTKNEIKETQKLIDKYKEENESFAMNISIAFLNDQISATQMSDFLLGLEDKDPIKKEAIITAIAKLDGIESDRLFRIFALAEGKVPVETILNIITDPNTDAAELMAQMELLAGSQVDVSVILRLPSSERIAALKNVNKLLNEFDSIDPEDKNLIANFMDENFELTKKQIKEFLRMPGVTQRRFVANFATVGNIQDPNVAKAAMMGFLKDEVGGKYKDYRYLAQLDKENRLASKYFSEFFKGMGDDSKLPPPDPDPEGSGKAEKSFLEQLMETLDANARLYLDAEKSFKGYEKHRGQFIGYFTKLRGMGASEELIAMLGDGVEGFNRAKELAALGKKGVQDVSKKLGQVKIGEFFSRTVPTKLLEGSEKRQAQSILTSDKYMKMYPEMSKDSLNAIASNAESATLIVAAAADKTGKELDRVVKTLIALDTYGMTPAEIGAKQLEQQRKPILEASERQQARFKKAFGELERQFKPGMESSKKIIEGLQDQIDLVQKQISEIEKLNQKDQDRIRGLERQKEMLERQIEAIERQNELDERQIETLNRQDQIRNRVSEAISKDLEIVSQQEEKIRDAYDKRFKALDKVAKVNDYLINQQKQQLNLSRAIAEGDIYAATAAAQEMRAASAQFSVEQTRAGLEEGMEGQIAGLRTAGGLTREQAEEQLRQIKEQSYQTSLLIRDIEDRIYDRNLELVPIKDQIRYLDDQIRSINDIIYERESQILDIQRSKLEPLQEQLNKEQDSLKNQERALANAKAEVRIEGLSYEQLQDKIDSEKEAHDVMVALLKTTEDNADAADNLLQYWIAITKQIAEANRVAQTKDLNAKRAYNAKVKKIDADIAAGRITEKQGKRKKDIAFDRYQSQLTDIESERTGSIAALQGSAQERMRTQGFYSGGLIKMGMGGKMKRYPMGGLIPYAIGGVAGDGARDSVLAKLTPGEFVIRKAMVNKYGDAMMRDINMGSFSVPRYNTPMMGDVKLEKVQNNNMISPVYNNYDMDFTISGSNASADEIANKVMFKIKQVQSSAIRSNRG
jgi:hypothetical protein